MRARVLVGVLFLFGVLATGAVATSGDRMASGKQWAVVQLINPVRVGPASVMGSLLIVHDDSKMARGLPCTSFYRFDPKTGPQEEVVSFHCIPRQRKVADQMTLTTVSSPRLNELPRLVEYQFAGDSEGHGVPAGR